MSKQLSDDALAAAVRGITVTDPLPDVDAAALATRGRRGVRRRRILSAAGLGITVAAVAAAATAVPLALGGHDSSPGPASGPSTKAVPTRAPTGDALLLKQCGAKVRADLTGWRIMAKAVEPGYLTTVLALDRAGKRTAECYLAGPRLPWDIPSGWNRIWAAKAPQTDVEEVHIPQRGDIPRHMFEQGTETCAADRLSGCVGFLFYETGRLPQNAARIHAVAANGRGVDVPVVDGWYAVAWGDREPRGMRPVRWTVYDARGKVLGRSH
jgi:hypothetical protein